MKISTLLLIFASVALSAFAQIALKFGVSSPVVQDSFAQGSGSGAALVAALTSPKVLAGLGLYGLGALLWLLVLAKLDVSVAYPFVGLGFILTMIFSIILLGEPVRVMRIAGTLFVVLGVILVARS